MASAHFQRSTAAVIPLGRGRQPAHPACSVRREWQHQQRQCSTHVAYPVPQVHVRQLVRQHKLQRRHGGREILPLLGLARERYTVFNQAGRQNDGVARQGFSQGGVPGNDDQVQALLLLHTRGVGGQASVSVLAGAAS